MVDIGLYVVLGFLTASLVALMLVPSFWNRAVRLTMRRLEATMPMSLAEIQADKDQIRAQFAIELRRLEVRLERARDKAARELVETNKRRVEITRLRSEVDGFKGRLQERDNANRVLEQTIRRRLPELEVRVKSAKEAIGALEGSNADLRTANLSQAEALKLARATINVQRSDIDQLRATLEIISAPPRRGRASSALAEENKRLATELSRLKEEFVRGTIGGRENELLRGELGKLARQILTVAKSQGTDLPAAPMRAAAAEIDENSDAEATAPSLALNGGGASEELDPPSEEHTILSDERKSSPEPLAAEPEEREEKVPQKVLFAATSKDFAPPPPEGGEKRGSLAELLASRRGKKRGPTRRASLTERLKGVRAEASDG